MRCFTIYDRAIQKGVLNADPGEVISRKIYLSYPTSAFIGQEDVEFEILNAVANHFKVPFPSVQVVGSAKTGFSYVKKKEFVRSRSDLDIAIISSRLFKTCLDNTYKETEGYTNFTKFERPDDSKKFHGKLILGFINPYNLPYGDFRENWIRFFNELSTHYYDDFKKISGGIYATQYLFEMKQYRAIERYRGEMGE